MQGGYREILSTRLREVGSTIWKMILINFNMIYILLLVLKVYAINLIVTTSNPNEVSLSGGLLIPKSANSITLGDT